jgi:beta-glucosidase
MESAMLILLIIFGALVAVSLYGNLRVHPPSRKIPIQGQGFPEGFLWATGEDAYQHEGGNLNNDWARWEATTPSPIEDGETCGPAIDFYNRYEDDFHLAVKDEQNAHRIGIEWSRVEPQMGIYDEVAWEHYETILLSLKEKCFVVFFNLWHFTLPLWAVDLGGWESPAVMERWEAFVKECATRFGNFVDYWSTMIDAQIYALAGYGLGEIPPCRRDIKLAVRIYHTLIHAHARAYHIIKEFGTITENGATKVPQVGMIYFFFHYEPKSFFLDRIVTDQTDKIFNWAFLDALHTGIVNIDILFGPSAKEHSAAIKGTLDWIGVNYYTREILAFNPFMPGMIDRITYAQYPTTDMGWEIYPEGIYHLCQKIRRRYSGIPIMIAENGLADAADNRRPQFILDHLAWIRRLIDEGCPIMGYTYWSLTDNWEWAKGFGPKFGLYRVDRQTMARSETRSARLYRFIAQHNRLPEQDELPSLLKP